MIINRDTKSYLQKLNLILSDIGSHFFKFYKKNN